MLIDTIVELVPGERVVAIRDIDPEEEYFKDHFPGFPVVPGVLLTEMMGQAAAKCLDVERRGESKAMLAKIRSATFRQWVRPGDRLHLIGEIKTKRKDVATAECRAEVDGKEVARADLMFSFASVEELSLDFRDEVLEDFLAANPDLLDAQAGD